MHERVAVSTSTGVTHKVVSGEFNPTWAKIVVACGATSDWLYMGLVDVEGWVDLCEECFKEKGGGE
jgi:hypothetical protein